VTVVPIPCRVEDGYHLPSRTAIESRITQKTKALLVCNPGNPTGVVYTEQEMEMLVDLARVRNLFLIGDEVYREFVYEGALPRSVLTYPDVADRVLVVDSISKRFSACGARVGCLVSRNRELMAAAMRFAQARLSPPTLGQILGEAALKLPPDYMRAVVDEYRERRQVVFEAVTSWPGTLALRPGGAFYQMARLPVDDAEKFIIWLLESFDIDGATTLMAPGEGFYATPGAGRDEVRIACVLNRNDLVKAMRIVGEGLLTPIARST
jgi:aspartate aminotransferase